MSVPCSVVTVRGGGDAGACDVEHLIAPDTPPSRAARRSARARCRAAARSATRAIVFASASRYCGSRNSGYGGTSTRSNDRPGHAGAPAERRLAADQMHLVAADRRARAPARSRPRRCRRPTRSRPCRSSSRMCFSRPERWTGSRTTMPSAKATPASAPNCASRLSIELPERRRRQSRRDRALVGGRELAAVAVERLALALVVRRDVDDERRRRAVVDEVVADPVGPPRLRVGLVAAQAALERRDAQHVAGGDVIGMAIVPVRNRDACAAGGAG